MQLSAKNVQFADYIKKAWKTGLCLIYVFLNKYRNSQTSYMQAMLQMYFLLSFAFKK